MKRSETQPWQELRDLEVKERLRTKVKAIRPGHAAYIAAVDKSVVTIVSGPAGTGKSWMACGMAAQMLRDGKVKKIILSRPLVTCGKGMGFLPGTLEEKVGPYMRPLMNAFEDFFSPTELEKYVSEEIIEMWPLDLMRGASIKNAVIIFDEAQNAEGLHQLHMLLTRPDNGTKIIISGDDTKTQTDIRHDGLNPLKEVILRFSRECHRKISIVRLTHADVVRNDFVQWVDERLSCSLEEATSGPADPWYELQCPGCYATLWYEDITGTWHNQAKCCSCESRIELWRGAEFTPRITNMEEQEWAVTWKDKPE